jgi:hypothetical protein
VDKQTRKIKGFAFVTYMMPQNAVEAFNQLDGTSFQVSVQKYKTCLVVLYLDKRKGLSSIYTYDFVYDRLHKVSRAIVGFSGGGWLFRGGIKGSGGLSFFNERGGFFSQGERKH